MTTRVTMRPMIPDGPRIGELLSDATSVEETASRISHASALCCERQVRRVTVFQSYLPFVLPSIRLGARWSRSKTAVRPESAT